MSLASALISHSTDCSSPFTVTSFWTFGISSTIKFKLTVSVDFGVLRPTAPFEASGSAITTEFVAAYCLSTVHFAVVV